jgi:BASS family bile acid:Na+ symporter
LIDLSLPANLAQGLGVLRNSSLIFTLAAVLGLGYPTPAKWFEPLIIPALFLMMLFSMTEVDFKARDEPYEAFVGFSINYLLLSGLILGMSFFLEDENLRQGFVVMAAVPPAIAVLPLSKLLGGDTNLSLFVEIICYLASLVLMPAIIFLFTGVARGSFIYILKIILVLILLPIIASRFIMKAKIDPVPPINLGFFLVTYTVIGLNGNSIFGVILAVSTIAFARTFFIGGAVYLATKLAGMQLQKRISYTLFASFKNMGMAAALSLAIFGPRASIPAAVCILAETLFYIFLAALHDHGILR